MDDVCSVCPSVQGFWEFFGTIVIPSQVGIWVDMMIVIDPSVDLNGLFKKAEAG